MDKTILILTASLLLVACDDIPEGGCPVIADHVYQEGSMAIHKPTGEAVRIVLKYRIVFAPTCQEAAFGDYGIRLSDGAEIKTSWRDLQPVE